MSLPNPGQSASPFEILTSEKMNDTYENIESLADGSGFSLADGAAIDDSNGNELIEVSVVGSAVNHVDISNAATGNAPTISATGGDTNIDINLTPKGTGRVVLNGAGAPATAYVATNESTSSTSYTDLATTTDQVTVTIGASGMALVTVSAQLVTGNQYVSFGVSGASTVSASDDSALFSNPANILTSKTELVTGLTAGSTTFKMKYKAGTAASKSFLRRSISVVPL